MSEICANGIDDNCDGQVDEGCTVNVVLNLKVFIEGLYISDGLMRPVLYLANLNSDSTASDSITVELHDPGTGSLILTSNALLHVDGNAQVLFPSSIFNQSYYLAIRHRNSIETWSKNVLLFDSSLINFDFTTE